MIWRKAACLALAASLAACSAAPGVRGLGGRPLPPVAHPSAVIAADLAFARLVRDSGWRDAGRRMAADGAIIFAPGPVDANRWLKNQPEPPRPTQRQPHRVISSCDGSLAATIGVMQHADGGFDQYLTVWQRQNDGSYEWLLHSAESAAEAQAAPDFLQSTVASCTSRPSPESLPTSSAGQAARDGSLRYDLTEGAADGPAELTLSYWDGEQFQEVYSRAVPPSPAG